MRRRKVKVANESAKHRRPENGEAKSPSRNFAPSERLPRSLGEPGERGFGRRECDRRERKRQYRGQSKRQGAGVGIGTHDERTTGAEHRQQVHLVAAQFDLRRCGCREREKHQGQGLERRAPASASQPRARRRSGGDTTAGPPAPHRHRAIDAQWQRRVRSWRDPASIRSGRPGRRAADWRSRRRLAMLERRTSSA